MSTTEPNVPLSARSARILVVDDNEDSADSLSILLSTQGYAVAVAYEGEAAITRALADRPDVILLDIGLSRMNGLEVCARIRQESWGADAVIIAISGWGQVTDLKRSKEAGFDVHLVKPVLFTDLVDTIVRLRRQRLEASSGVLSRQD